MGAQLMGTYEGEGTNVSGALATTANVPDIPTASKDSTGTGQGRTSAIAIDIRRRIRTSSEPARSAIAINYGGGDQTFTKCTRAILITGGTGSLVVRMADDSADVTLGPGLVTGQVYSFAVAIIRQSGSNATGVALF